METTLGLLGGSGNGSSGVSSNESKVEVLDVGMSSEATSYPEGAELELGLGLGLSIGGGGGAKAWPSAWGDRGRILTAKDFPSSLCPALAISGTKRAADSGPQEGASPPRSSQLVGWPPIRAYRMNSLVNQAKTPRGEEDKAVHVKGHSKDVFKTTLKAKEHAGFIKVNMDGMGIGRKVDLSVHACYETLGQSLEDMFFKLPANVSPIESDGEKELPMKSSKLFDGSSEFVLTYEDKDGDWMLVGDVPWRMFVSTVKRLRIMRASEAKGLAPRVQDTNER